jgi:FkbM family methyltransferase|tara:strand:+ start:2016 stop:2633 length:618 start_codon:yes stop_codon:yes gene_type:complete
MNWVDTQHQALSKLIQPDWHYADVGACIGEMSDFLWPKMKMGHLFEPSPANYERLRRKYPFLGDDRLVINNYAVSNENGVCNFSVNVDDSHTGNIKGSLPPSHPKDYREEMVSVKTVNLDTYFKDKRIDLIKIDVEGAEWDVLEGAREIMSSRSIIFQIEFHWDEDWHRKSILEELGHHIYDLNFKKLAPDAPRPYQAIVSKEDL